MKTCKNCGASINDDSRFCTQCGADTFEGAAEEQTAVLSEPSAQPATDSGVSGGEYYQPAAAQAEPADQSGEVYYQPAESSTESSAASAYTYTVPTDQVPVGKGKKKGRFGRVGAIILSVIIVVGAILVKVGIRALDYIDLGDVASSLSSISEGYENESLTAYINASVNFTIDSTKGGMEILSDEAKYHYFGDNSDIYETYLYDFDTDEGIYVMMAEGTVAESATNLKSFAKEIAESIYEGESNVKFGDVYELEIAGNKYTCIDITQTVEDDYYGSYVTEQTLCFIKSTNVFLEISVTAFPEETGRNTKDLIDQYIVPIK